MSKRISNIDIEKKLAARTSFVMHRDSGAVFKQLTHEEAWLLINAIFDYQSHGIEPEDRMTSIMFAPFKAQFERDAQKYIATCQARATSGAKGGKKKAANSSKPSKCYQKVAKGSKPSKTYQKVANLADSDSNSNSKSKSKSEKQTITPPPTTTKPTNPTLPKPMIGSISALGGK